VEIVCPHRRAQLRRRLFLFAGQRRARQVWVHWRKRWIGRHIDAAQRARLGQPPHHTRGNPCRLGQLRRRHRRLGCVRHIQHFRPRIGHPRRRLPRHLEHSLGRRGQQPRPRPQRHGQKVPRMADRVACRKVQEVPHRLRHGRGRVDLADHFQRATLARLIAQNFHNDSKALILSERRGDIAALFHVQIIGHRIIKRLRQGQWKENPRDRHGRFLPPCPQPVEPLRAH